MPSRGPTKRMRESTTASKTPSLEMQLTPLRSIMNSSSPSTELTSGALMNTGDVNAYLHYEKRYRGYLSADQIDEIMLAGGVDAVLVAGSATRRWPEVKAKGVINEWVRSQTPLQRRSGPCTTVMLPPPEAPVSTVQEISSDYRGRPTIYRDDFPGQLQDIPLATFSILAIAQKFKVSISSVNYWFKHHPSFRAAYEERHSLKRKAGNTGGRPSKESPAPSFYKRLVDLKKIFEGELITQEEYDEKRREILKRL